MKSTLCIGFTALCLGACGYAPEPELAVKLDFRKGPDTVVYRRSVTSANRDSSAARGP